ncbi:MAG: aminotransferase class III-fold pyridoxal phosphate-dependent enzyme [Pseudomonadota bacterium]
MLKLTSQTEWAERAHAVLPGGDFGNFGAGVVVRDGQGARVHDEDGNEYVDLLIGSGPMLLGHGHPEVLEAVYEQLPKGMTFFATNARGIELAEEICSAVPCADQVRFVSTGGEADMYAIRMARAFTGRDLILKFEGGYHGMSAEAQMSLAPTQLVNFPQAVPDSGGIPESVRSEMLIAPFNDAEYLRSLLTEYGDRIAGIIVEPLQRIVPPVPGFLEAVREEATKHGIVLIFDEVVTGFRLAYGGAQEKYAVVPDICTLGKIIGGGLPLAAIAGRADIMAHYDKTAVPREKWLMQLGTLSGNPVAAAAGLKTMEILRRDGQYDALRAKGGRLQKTISGALDDSGHDYRIVGDPTLFEIVFTGSEVRDYRDTFHGDAALLGKLNTVLRDKGVFKAPGKTYPCLALDESEFEIVSAAYNVGAKAIAQ